jgi:hypothetical protein
MVEQDERRQLRALLIVEHGVHREAVADPVGFALAVDAEDVFHPFQMGAEPPKATDVARG